MTVNEYQMQQLENGVGSREVALLNAITFILGSKYLFSIPLAI